MSVKVAIQNCGDRPIRVRAAEPGPNGERAEAPAIPPGFWIEVELRGAGLTIEAVPEPAPTEGEPA